MRHNLGSRRRFLFRLVIYLLTPLLGLVIIMSPAPATDEVPAGGTWLGWIAISVGLVAQYLLLSRLRQPLGAVRYALHPATLLSRLIEQELQKVGNLTANHELFEKLKNRLVPALPDVLIEDESLELTSSQAMIIGDENILVVMPSPTSAKQIEGIASAIAQIRSPLSNDKLFAVLLDKIDSGLKIELQNKLSNSRIYELD